MTAKRFQWVYIKDNSLELIDNVIVKRFNNERLEELLNELSEDLKHELTVSKALRDVVRGLENENEQLKKEVKALNDFIVLEPIGDDWND